MHQTEINAMKDVFTFFGKAMSNPNAHNELPKQEKELNRCYEIVRDLCGDEVAKHMVNQINQRMAVTRIASKW